MKTNAKDYAQFVERLYKIQNDYLPQGVVGMINDDQEKICSINTNTREIVIDNSIKTIGVKTDHDAETLYFEMDRYFDNTDLFLDITEGEPVLDEKGHFIIDDEHKTIERDPNRRKVCVIQFVNAQNQGFVYTSKNIYRSRDDESKFYFDWKISHEVTAAPGTVRFAIRIYSIKKTGGENTNIFDADGNYIGSNETFAFSYNFNTKVNELKVVDGLNIDVLNPSFESTWYTDSVNRIYALIPNIADDLYNHTYERFEQIMKGYNNEEMLKNFDEVKAKVEEFETQFSEVQNLPAQFTALQGTVETMHTQCNDNFTTVQTILEQMPTIDVTNDLGNRLDTLEEEFSKAQTDINKINDLVAATDSLTDQVSTLKSSTTESIETLNTFKDTVTDLLQLDSDENTLTAHNNAINSILQDLASQNQDIATLNSSLDDLAEHISTLEAIDSDNRIKALEDMLASTSEDNKITEIVKVLQSLKKQSIDWDQQGSSVEAED